ncbi:hypothetical protein PpBr36_01325 [Pyricularia pennisetigena]|nr:hypothetical protein PpBr36_01325 [Pyricularia pennisetigena]TLS29280.1 hypothetical protein PpBr36_01325 [Pyricularia pennisetigena]
MSARKIFNPCSGSFAYGVCARSSGLSSAATSLLAQARFS